MEVMKYGQHGTKRHSSINIYLFCNINKNNRQFTVTLYKVSPKLQRKQHKINQFFPVFYVREWA